MLKKLFALICSVSLVGILSVGEANAGSTSKSNVDFGKMFNDQRTKGEIDYLWDDTLKKGNTPIQRNKDKESNKGTEKPKK